MALAGQQIRASDVPPSAWSAFTPAWTAATTNPVIGNGSLSAVYYQVGDVVFYKGFLQAGATTTYGTGVYSVSLPIAANTAYSNVAPEFGGRFLDASAGTKYYGGFLLPTSMTMQLVGVGATYAAATDTWAPTVPVTMATSDYIAWSFSYQTAA